MRSQFEDEIRKKLKDVSVDTKPILFGAILLKFARLRKLRLLKMISFATISSLIIAGAGYLGYKATQNPSPMENEITLVDNLDENSNDIASIGSNENNLSHDTDENNHLAENLSTIDALQDISKNIDKTKVFSARTTNTIHQADIEKDLTNDEALNIEKNTSYTQQELVDKFKEIIAENEGSDINNAKIWTKLSDDPVEVPHRNIKIIENENDNESTVVWKKSLENDNLQEEPDETIVNNGNELISNETNENDSKIIENTELDNWSDFIAEEKDANETGNFDPDKNVKNKYKNSRISLEGSYGYGRAARSLSGTNRSLIETRNNSEISNYSDLSRIGVNVMLTEKWEINAGIILGNRRSITATTFQVPYLRDEIIENKVEINVPGFGTRTVTWYDTTQVEDIKDEEFKERNFQRTIRIPLSLSYTHYFDKYVIFCRGGVSVDVWTKENQTWIMNENDIRRTPTLPLKTDTYIRYNIGIGGGYKFHKNWMAIVMPTLDLGSNRITDQTLGIRQIDYGIFTTFGLRYNF